MKIKIGNNILSRVGLAIFLSAIISSITMFVVFFQKSSEMIVGLKLANILNHKNYKEKTVNYQELLNYGIDEDWLLKALNDSEEAKTGYVKTNYFGNIEALGVLPASEGFYTIRSSRVDLLAIFRDHFIALFGLLTISSLVLSSIVILITKKVLSPLSTLRTDMENVLVGNYAIKSNYGGRDDLGIIINAMKKLTIEIDQKEEELATISEMATTDSLTTMNNHRAFKNFFHSILSKGMEAQNYGLFILDIDKFKNFNDTYGHLQGDEVLRVVGGVMKKTAAVEQFVGRYGGEEFVSLFPSDDIEIAKAKAEIMRKAIEETEVDYLKKPGQKLSVTASFGVVQFNLSQRPEGCKNDEFITQLIETADKGLYSAKENGRNRCEATNFDS
ncbi:MAG: GGDEF domain-containing protein [Bdellovibrionota bacterium]|nr:GGDEF domain-containing protein [Bdellovibrionota bacterium]